MLRTLGGRCIGALAVVCVLLLFFFPLMMGPFPATHGPVTALRAWRYFLMLLVSVVSPALYVFATRRPAFRFSAIRLFAGEVVQSHPMPQFGSPAVLRC